MPVNISEEGAKSVVLEFDGVDQSIPELIKAKLLEMPDVEFASVERGHFEIGKPRLVVKSSKNAKSAVIKVLEELEEEVKELQNGISKK